MIIKPSPAFLASDDADLHTNMQIALAEEYKLTDIATTRTALINAIFGQDTLPTDTCAVSGSGYTYTSVLGALTYVQQMALTEATGTANGKLVILIHGHDAFADVAKRDRDFDSCTDGAGDHGDLLRWI